MLAIFRNQKFWCVVAGAAGVIIGKKILTAKTTRELAVNGLAKGMMLQNTAKETFQNIKDEAEDICYDARQKAASENELNQTDEVVSEDEAENCS